MVEFDCLREAALGVTVRQGLLFFTLLLLFLAMNVSLVSAGPNLTGEGPVGLLPIMRPGDQELARQIAEYDASPVLDVSLPTFRALDATSRSKNLLGQIDYTPEERSQQPTGNCWVWAGNGLLEIAHSVQDGVRDRLSVQYVDSGYNGGEGQYWAGNGGTLGDLVRFYRGTGRAIPWSNRNASFQDGRIWCIENNRAWVPASQIAVEPYYPITRIEERRIATRGVSRSTAIARIKSVLDQNRGVYFTLRLPNEAAWTDFNRFWMDRGEDAVFNLAPYAGTPWEPWTGGAHSVICVGYDETSRSWLMLNSWGTAQGNRPHGLFRVSMDFDYSGIYPYSIEVPATQWEALEVAFGASPAPTPASGWYVNHLLPCRIEAEDYDLGGANVAYQDTTPGNAGGRYRQDDVDIETIGDGSGYTVAYTRTGEWIRYTISAGSPGAYDLIFRVSSPYEGSLIEFSIDDGPWQSLGIPDTGSFYSYALLSVPVEVSAGGHAVYLRFRGAGQNCDYIEFVPRKNGDVSTAGGTIRAESSPSGASVLLDGVIVGITPMTLRDVVPGTHQILFTKRGWESTTVTCRVEVNQTLQVNRTLDRLVPTPYRTSTLPCSIEAEHFNLGGEGIGFHDVDWWNLGGQFRNEGVDIELTPETGNYKVAWIRSGEWLGYTINNPVAGRYRLGLFGCALDNGASISIELDGEPGPTIHLPWSSDYNHFGRTETEINVPEGVHVLRLTFTGRQNLDRMDLGLAEQTPTPTLTPTPEPVSAKHLPSRIEAEDYDPGRSGVTHNDTTPGNEGGVYRNDSVDIQVPSPGSSPVVSFTEDGEWLRYTVAVDSATLFHCTFRLAGTGSPASIFLAVDGEPRLGVNAPLNGTASGFSTHTRTVGLSSGLHQLNLSFTGNLSVDYMEFRSPSIRATP